MNTSFPFFLIFFTPWLLIYLYFGSFATEALVGTRILVGVGHFPFRHRGKTTSYSKRWKWQRTRAASIPALIYTPFSSSTRHINENERTAHDLPTVVVDFSWPTRLLSFSIGLEGHQLRICSSKSSKAHSSACLFIGFTLSSRDISVQKREFFVIFLSLVATRAPWEKNVCIYTFI